MKDKEYKEIELFDKKMFYTIKEFTCGDHGVYTCYTTRFYDIKEYFRYKKKYFLFGPIIEVIYHKELFTLNYSIATPDKTKDEVRSGIKIQLDLLERKEEIKRGDII